MAIFNVPTLRENHEDAAVRAALECTHKLKHLNKRWLKVYGFELFHRVGINTGSVLAGNVGPYVISVCKMTLLQAAVNDWLSLAWETT